MKKTAFILALVMLLCGIAPAAVSADNPSLNSAPRVIPAIREWNPSTGKFVPKKGMRIVLTSGTRISDELKKIISGYFSDIVGIEISFVTEDVQSGDIILTLSAETPAETDDARISALGNEGYIIDVNETANIFAFTSKGLLYGIITILQSYIADGFMPCGEVYDYPSYPTKSPETYFQSAFRVQSPWVVNGKVMKTNCYIFDFSLNRALMQIADYGCRLNIDAAVSPEQKVKEFISYLPVLAYDGNVMRPIDAEDILDYAMSGTSATLLARRWESPLLVNVDDDTLKRLMANQKALDALMSIESFRNLNKDLEAIISKSEKVKKEKKEAKEKTAKEKRELSADEKECKSLRKQVQEKLIKFATKIPLFMYLTDYREETLVDVITQFEPELFKKVTGLDIADFELLVSLNVFNGELMNDAIYKFKRYEDASLRYMGITKHTSGRIGLFSTVITE